MKPAPSETNQFLDMNPGRNAFFYGDYTMNAVDCAHENQDSLHMLSGVVERLICPNHGEPLRPVGDPHALQGVPWPDGELRCAAGCVYPIQEGIPRLVEAANYTSAFGLQWRRYRRTQLDSHTGQPISRRGSNDAWEWG